MSKGNEVAEVDEGVSGELDKKHGASASDSNGLLETRINIPSIGLGTLRTGATWIAVILMAEDDPAKVLTSVMKELKITPEEIHDDFYDKACSKCGISLLAHRDNYGECF